MILDWDFPTATWHVTYLLLHFPGSRVIIMTKVSNIILHILSTSMSLYYFEWKCPSLAVKSVVILLKCLASSAKKSASAEASASCAFPPYQEKPKLTIWTAIFYPVPEIFVNLRFRSDTSLHLRHTPVEDRPGEYHECRWPLSAQIPAGI